MAEYIDKSRLLNGLDRYDFPNDESYEITFDVIDSAPIKDVEPVKHAEWLNVINPISKDDHCTGLCSNCGKRMSLEWEYDKNGNMDIKEYYCRKCGAKMDKNVK